MKPLVLHPSEAAEMLRCSRATFYALAKRPDFPKPIPIGPRRGRRYFIADLTAWLRKQQEVAS